MTTLTTFIADIGADLANGASVVWSDAQLGRAIVQALAELSGYFPREMVKEIRLVKTVSDESFTSSNDTAVSLTNSPIKRHSEVVKQRDAITAFADYSGTVTGTVSVTSGTHGLTTGDTVTISGTTNYNGTFTITTIDANDFYITATWVADDGASLWIGGTTYTKDTDYWVDYISGTITTLSTGSIVNATATNISYQRDPTIINTSGELTNPIDISLIEADGGLIPREVIQGQWHGDYLTLLTTDRGGQEGRADYTHIRVYYLSIHTEPTPGAAGSMPESLANLLIKGAGGYALRLEAINQYNLADIDLGLANTAVALMPDEANELDTALDAMNTTLGSAATALGTLETTDRPLHDAVREMDEALTALGSVTNDLDSDADAQLVLAVTALGNIDTLLLTGGENADAEDAYDSMTGVITNISNIIALLRGEAGEPYDDMKTAVDLAAPFINGNTDSMKEQIDLADTAAALLAAKLIEGRGNSGEPWTDAGVALDAANVTATTSQMVQAEVAMDKVDSAITGGATGSSIDDVLDGIVAIVTAAGTALDAQIAELASETRHADGYLDDGDALLNTIAVGGSPQGAVNDYLGFANAKIAMAQAYGQEADGRLSMAQTRISEARERFQLVQAHIGEATGRMRMADTYITEAQVRMGMFDGILREIDTQVNTIQTHINLAMARKSQAEAFLEEARSRKDIADLLIDEIKVNERVRDTHNMQAQGYIAVAQGFISEARERTAVARGYLELGQTRVAQATEYRQVAQTRIAHANAVVSQANVYTITARGYAEEVEKRIEMGNMYAQQASAYQNSVLRRRELAEGYSIEAERRIQEFRAALSDRVQTRQSSSIASVHQWQS